MEKALINDYFRLRGILEKLNKKIKKLDEKIKQVNL